MGSPNWGNLVAKNRVKAVGVPWNEKELNAIHILKIPADYVRKGFLTMEDYEKQLEKEHSPLWAKGLEEVKAIAKEKGINFTPEATKESLAVIIEDSEKEELKATETKEEVKEDKKEKKTKTTSKQKK